MPGEIYLGMISGTSADGIDVAALHTDGETIHRLGASATFEFRAATQRSIRQALGSPVASQDLVDAVTTDHVEAARQFLDAHSIPARDVRALGFHGQTILHRPSAGISLQIGDGKRLAETLCIDVVDQFRIHDVEAGGQGAPIAPIFHAALMRGGPLPSAMINIGGIANITWFDGARILAFDTGLGNARLDDWMRQRAGLEYDSGGSHASSGVVNNEVLRSALTHEFYDQNPPKSLDRDEIIIAGLNGASLEDGAATLAAITADTISRASRFLPSQPHRWIISGGGRHNRAIMNRLREQLGNVVATENLGVNGDAVEAYLIAYLAARKLAGLPSTFPHTTGVNAPAICGVLRSVNAIG